MKAFACVIAEIRGACVAQPFLWNYSSGAIFLGNVLFVCFAVEMTDDYLCFGPLRERMAAGLAEGLLQIMRGFLFCLMYMHVRELARSKWHVSFQILVLEMVEANNRGWVLM